MSKKYQMYINGQWVDSSSGEIFDSVNPYNQKIWATIPQATKGDVNQAITAANHSFHKQWKNTSGKERSSLLHNLADIIERNADYMAEIESTDNGKVIRETKHQMMFAARNYRYFAGYADKLQGTVVPMDNPDLFDYTIVEPLGVAALITAWNSPITLLANKLAPALATGNTVVVKPSEHASVSTLEFGKLIEKAGFPAGVVNIITGDGNVGEALTSSPNIQKISFTGGLNTARMISRSASENLTPVTTELGGKSPNIIFEDANLDDAVLGAVAGIFAASGQTCVAGSRLLVQDSIYDKVVDKIVNKASKIKLGNPLIPETEMGPVANRAQFTKITQMINDAISEGAKLLLGKDPIEDESLQEGYFIRPTIFGDVNNSMTIAQEEVFGPVLSIIRFKEEKDAIKIANDSKYGLASGVWTNSVKRAHRMAKNIEAGSVWLNTYRTLGVGAPFGGMKLSGNGRERSWHTLLDYTKVKNVMLDMSDNVRDPFSLKT
ncbi:aldehyde dehydrogenase [Salirhabdus salicampi]|uniref:aldehyde dehydrogenase n=1 Tax=Salirhabdus salicampi TaxID=476102 RepID=UPI0020C45FCA|nr:aldehyde dehydrogenase [Salirhabdus salicampi]MCP8615826.1 aldehyde dehydrogenase [Salirhabdus salicampi]